MAQHLALAACQVAHQGSWMRVKGENAVVKVIGSEVRLDVELETSVISLRIQPGLTSLETKGWRRCRAVKEADGSPTTVRIMEE